MRTLAALIVLAVIWAAGLFAFADRIDRSTPAAEPQLADGVVALTGAGSNERIAAGVSLLENGKARRMLVSGVNREATREDVRAVSGAVRRLYDCCVDLGFTANDTIGNARETAEWAKAMRYKSLIIVTADYHMPRAMLELRSTLPDARLQTYPIATSVVNAHRWWRTTGGARLMVVEYSKYLAILGREMVRGLGPRDAPASAPLQNPSPSPKG
jgi:uncharacterized SAM-binding protein YcdF (DUF218 family)